jgi:hypothetical protein
VIDQLYFDLHAYFHGKGGTDNPSVDYSVAKPLDDKTYMLLAPPQR